MVDAERLLAMLARVTARLRVLEQYAAVDAEELLADRVRMGDLKYTYQTCIEACIDAAQHVVAAAGLGAPASNAEAFRLLGVAGMIDAELATTMAGAVGFRNILVHGYAEVDDHRVVEHLDQLPELRRFVRDLAHLLHDLPGTAEPQA
jgi:uncharacterized protein YutE (UPF0331/DUF86 family)